MCGVRVVTEQEMADAVEVALSTGDCQFCGRRMPADELAYQFRSLENVTALMCKNASPCLRARDLVNAWKAKQQPTS